MPSSLIVSLLRSSLSRGIGYKAGIHTWCLSTPYLFWRMQRRWFSDNPIPPSFGMGKDALLAHDTIGDFFDSQCRTFPLRPALICPSEDIKWSYGNLQGYVDGFAGGLVRNGFERGSRLAVLLPDVCPELIPVFLACFKVGVTVVVLDPLVTDEELRYQLRKTQARGVLVGAMDRDRYYMNLLTTVAPELHTQRQCEYNVSGLPDLKYAVHNATTRHVSGMWMLTEFFQFYIVNDKSAPSPPYMQQVGVQSTDDACIMFTPSVSRPPQPIVHNQFSLLNAGIALKQRLELDMDNVMLAVSLSHWFGLSAYLACVVAGSCVVLPPRNMRASGLISTLRSELCSRLIAFPRVWKELAKYNYAEDRFFPYLRKGVTGAFPCGPRDRNNVSIALDIPLQVIYGSVETGAALVTNTKSRTSVGSPLNLVNVKIVDDNGIPVPIGHEGRLMLGGLASEFRVFQDHKATQMRIDNAGYFDTGDLAIMRETGEVDFIGKTEPIERVLRTVELVRAAAVIDVETAQEGKRLRVAFLELSKDARGDDVGSIQKAAHDACVRELDARLVPNVIHILERLPRSLYGVVQRDRLHALARQRISMYLNT